jgi:hypothetical protein
VLKGRPRFLGTELGAGISLGFFRGRPRFFTLLPGLGISTCGKLVLRCGVPTRGVDGPLLKLFCVCCKVPLFIPNTMFCFVCGGSIGGRTLGAPFPGCRWV